MQSDKRLEIHHRVGTADELPVDVLAEASGLSRQAIKRAMQKGAVWLTRSRNTQRLRRVKRALRVGDELHLYYDPKVLDEIAAAPELIADVGGYSVWNKPFGLRSQGSKWGDHCTITRWAERHLSPERPAFTVHRLDRAAKGLILVAHSKAMASSLSQLFSERQIEKRYRARVHGDFSVLAAPTRVQHDIDGKPATSEFSFREFDVENSQSLVDVSIETGRKHQVRRHFAHLGFPIVGDRLYGRATVGDMNLQLTACRLAFVCPVNERRVCYALPNCD